MRERGAGGPGRVWPEARYQEWVRRLVSEPGMEWEGARALQALGSGLLSAWPGDPRVLWTPSLKCHCLLLSEMGNRPPGRPCQGHSFPGCIKIIGFLY